MVNGEVIKGLQPELAWKHLAKIAEIPRGSGNEEGARAYVLSIAEKCGLQSKIDTVGNLLVKKPATVGHENAPSIALQGHLDMVCEKNADVVHDFLKDPIRFVRNGDIIKANGTTAGFDNGIAVAVMCAIMEETTLAHGLLEMLFTIDEETGLTGANGLEKGFLESKTLINLDCEKDKILYIGCAGGQTMTGTKMIAKNTVPSDVVACYLKISGLKSGHSGVDIHKDHPNAIKVFARIFSSLALIGASLSSVIIGNKHNVIPQKGKVTFFLPKNKVEEARAIVQKWEKTIKKEYGRKSGKFYFHFGTFKNYRLKNKALVNVVEQNNLLEVLHSLPHGIHKMSTAMSDLVETSNNLASIKISGGKISILLSNRSSSKSGMEDICIKVKSVLQLGQFSIKEFSGYPGWNPDTNSPILKHGKMIYEQLFEKKPSIKAIHAGLECGVIGGKYPEMDMLSIGPKIDSPHTPDERMKISTVPKFWEFLTTLLADIK
jgi:dipeptidase D